MFVLQLWYETQPYCLCRSISTKNSTISAPLFLLYKLSNDSNGSLFRCNNTYVALYGGSYLPYSSIITGYWWLFGYHLLLCNLSLCCSSACVSSLFSFLHLLLITGVIGQLVSSVLFDKGPSEFRSVSNFFNSF